MNGRVDEGRAKRLRIEDLRFDPVKRRWNIIAGIVDGA